MKSLKELLFTGMFVAMASVMFVACGGGEDADAPDVPEAIDKATDAAAEGSDSATDVVKEATSAVKDAAAEVKEAADDEEWFPEDELPSASAANNN